MVASVDDGRRRSTSPSRSPSSPGSRTLPLDVGVGGVWRPTPVCGWRVERYVLADQVVRLERGGAGDLVEVQRRALREHRDVDRLARLLREPATDRARFLDDVEPGGRGAGEPEQADAEAVLAAVLGLL